MVTAEEQRRSLCLPENVGVGRITRDGATTKCH